jgi:hypothetical protein
VTEPNDDEFDALIESAYAEPLMITGSIGDDDFTQVAPTPDRDGVDLGVAGSLVQARTRLRIQRRADLGPPYRDTITVAAATALLACAVAGGVLIGGGRLPGPAVLSALLAVVLIVGAAGSAWVLIVRYGPTTAEQSLTAAIAAEQRAGRELAAALAGASWVLFHDRRLPHSEHRVPFIAVGPAGVALIAILPAGPYLILTPAGVKAGEDELTSGWLPARIWESRYLMRQLIDIATRDLRFTGPVIPMAVEGHPRAKKIPNGWSAEPPYQINQYQIRRPAVLGQYLTYLPAIFAPRHVAQLAKLVGDHCPPAAVAADPT